MTDTTPPVAPTPVAAPVSDGKTLGIIALVSVFFFGLLGIVLGLIAKNQSKQAGVKNTPATVAIVLGFVSLAVAILLAILLPIITASSIAALCSGLEPGIYQATDGSTVTCP